MQLKRINSAIDRNERNKLNDNFELIERGQSSIQLQVNQLVVNGDSSIEAAQARVSEDNTVYTTLKERLDKENLQITQQLERVEKHLVFNLLNYPRQPDETNDTGRFKRAFVDIANKIEKVDFDGGYDCLIYTTLVINDGHYIIDDEIAATVEQMDIISLGNVVIEQTDHTKNIFSFNRTHKLSIKNLKFAGGKNQIYLQNSNLDATIIKITECEFKFSRDYAIKTLGVSAADDHLSANVKISDCLFMDVNGVIDDVSDYCRVDGGWVYVTKNYFTANRAVFLNRKGAMALEGIVAVPTLGQFSAHLLNTRWIDNYGIIKCYNMRFGGENGGLPIVYNFAGELGDGMGAQIHIEACQLFPGDYYTFKDSAVVYLMYEVPQQITITGCNYMLRAPYIAKPNDFNLTTYFDGKTNVQEKFNIKIENNMESEVNTYSNRYPTELKRFIDGESFDFTSVIASGYTGQIIVRNSKSKQINAVFRGSIPESEWTVMATLPTHVRPSVTISFPIVSGAVNSGMGQIRSNGEIVVYFKQPETEVYLNTTF